MNTTNDNKLEAVLLNDGTTIDIELPRLGQKGRSLQIRFYPKTAENPIAEVGLEFEIEGNCYQLAHGEIHSEIFNDIISD